MPRTNVSLKRLTRRAACLPVLVGLLAVGGCSFDQQSHFIEPEYEPMLSLNAVASAEGQLPPQVFSLVAADNLGLSTFGYEIAMWDLMYEKYALAD